MVTFLIENGADLKARDNDGCTAFDLAVTKLNYNLAYFLFSEHGLNPSKLSDK